MRNQENKKWWDNNTMSYAEWDLDDKIRLKDLPENINEVNQKYISENQFLKDYGIIPLNNSGIVGCSDFA